jgi:hypothetical protein
MQTRTVMKFHPRIAPVKAAVFPLVKKDGMPEVAQELYSALKKRLNVFYDEKGAVGRRTAAKTKPVRRFASPSMARGCRTAPSPAVTAIP